MKHLLVVIATALVIASCSAGETTSTTSVEVAKNQISKENPYSLADIPGAQTTLAKNETEIFTGIYGYYGDLILPDFSCEAISRVTTWNVSVCTHDGNYLFDLKSRLSSSLFEDQVHISLRFQ